MTVTKLLHTRMRLNDLERQQQVLLQMNAAQTVDLLVAGPVIGQARELGEHMDVRNIA